MLGPGPPLPPRLTPPCSPTQPRVTPPTHRPQVGDRCSECDDDHVDILQDRPFSFAPFNPSVGHDNYNAPYVRPGGGRAALRLQHCSVCLASVGAHTA